MPLLVGTGWALEWLSERREGSCPWSHIPCTTTPHPDPEGSLREWCAECRRRAWEPEPLRERPPEMESCSCSGCGVVESVPSLTAAGRRAQALWAGLAFLRARLPCRHSGLVSLGPHRSLFGYSAPLPQPLGCCLLGLPWGSATLAAICAQLPERQRTTWGRWEVTPAAREMLGAGGGES